MAAGRNVAFKIAAILRCRSKLLIAYRNSSSLYPAVSSPTYTTTLRTVLPQYRTIGIVE